MRVLFRGDLGAILIGTQTNQLSIKVYAVFLFTENLSIK